MPVPQRVFRIRALDPKRIGLFRNRDGQHDMVHLSERRETREEIGAIGIKDQVIRRDTGFGKHGAHEIDQRLAVSESGFHHSRRGEWLVTAQTVLNADVSCIIPQITIDDTDFLLCSGTIRRHLPDLGPEILRQVIRSFLQVIMPAGDILPGPL